MSHAFLLDCTISKNDELMGVSFKLLKCNNAYKFLRITQIRQWHSHIIHKDLP